MNNSVTSLLLAPLFLTLACSDDSDASDERSNNSSEVTGTGGDDGGPSPTGSGGASDPNQPCDAGCTGGLSAGGGTGASDGTGGVPLKTPAPHERVVGYLPTYRSLNPAPLPFETLTHLCIAFANTIGDTVDFDASPAAIHTLVDSAHASGVSVLASIAGAAGGQVVEDAIQPAGVDDYVNKLVDLVERYGLDGIDVDIEGNHVSWTYEPFVKKLAVALPEGALLTAAVATWNGSDFPDGALAEFDFVNLMSYDHCGSWSDPCEHSSYEEAISELQYWEGTRGLGAGRVVLGVPFYGYCWGDSCPAGALTYADILADYPDAATTDYLTGPGYEISFNRPETIARKTVLSKDHGGIMIWELGQDATGDDSLMSVIAANQ